MSYTAAVEVEFIGSPQLVYQALCQLGRYPEWNQDMIMISNTGTMTEGLRYHTESKVAAGQINASDVEVVKLVPDQEICLRSHSGIIAFEAVFTLKERKSGTLVKCALKFNFTNFVMQLAQPAIEAMARDRVRRDLEKLSALLSTETSRL